MSKRVLFAEELFNKGFLCSQAVFASFSDLLGLDKETALKIGSGFGGGIARKQEVCGAVSGAVMIIGLLSLHGGESLMGVLICVQKLK